MQCQCPFKDVKHLRCNSNALSVVGCINSLILFCICVRVDVCGCVLHTCEQVAVAQFWSSLGDCDIAIDVVFRGVTCSPQEVCAHVYLLPVTQREHVNCVHTCAHEFAGHTAWRQLFHFSASNSDAGGCNNQARSEADTRLPDIDPCGALAVHTVVTCDRLTSSPIADV